MKKKHDEILLKRVFDPFEWDPERIYFYDRDEEYKRFLNSLDDVSRGKPTIMMVSGPAGAGKSCFLKYLEKNMANEDKYYPVYLRWHEQHILGLAPFLQEFCNQLLKERKYGNARRIWLRMKDSFEMTLPIFDLLGISRLTVLGASIDFKGLMFTDKHSDVLKNLFVTIGKAMTAVFSERIRGEKGILFFLVDQAEDLLIMDKGLKTDALTFLLVLLKFVYANSPANRRIVFVFAVTDRNYAEFHAKLTYHKPRGIGIEAIRIEMFNMVDSRQLIEETINIGMKRKKTGRDWSIESEVIERIADLSRGNPAWIHEIGRSLRIKLEKAIEEGTREKPIVDSNLYSVAVPELIHDLVMTNLEPIKNSETQCKILEFIAQKGRATPEEIAKTNIRGLKDLGHDETVQQIEGILGTGFLMKIGGTGWLSVYEVPEWVRDPIIGALYKLEQDREREILARKESRIAEERTRLDSQIESVHKLLESAEETLAYWKGQYDRYQQKKQLEIKRRFLERELAWLEVAKREKVVMELKDFIQKQTNELSRVEDQTKSKSQKLNQYNDLFETAKSHKEMKDTANLIINTKIALALLQYRKKSIMKDIKKAKKELKIANSDFNQTVGMAEEAGPKIESTRNVVEVLDDIRIANGHLAALADVSEDIERMYESYSKLYLELQSKAKELQRKRG